MAVGSLERIGPGRRHAAIDQRRSKIAYSDLLELIKNSDNKDGKNYIEVKRKEGDKEVTDRLSNPAR